MADVLIERINEQKKKDLDIPESPKETDQWSVWECEPSVFDWEYNSQELAFVYQGEAKVTAGLKEYDIKAGDFVTFPKGLRCQWNVLEKIIKVYQMR